MQALWILAVCGWVGAVWAAGEAPVAEQPAGSAAAAQVAAAPAGEVQVLLGDAQRRLLEEKWSEAAALYEKILQKDPGSQEATFGLGTAYGQLERYSEALGLLEGLLKQTQDSPALKNNIAWIYVKAKDPAVRDPQKALKLARDAVLVTPADYNIWNTLAEAYYGLKTYDKALRSARQALRLSQLAGVPDDRPYQELVDRCQSALDKAAKGPPTQ